MNYPIVVLKKGDTMKHFIFAVLIFSFFSAYLYAGNCITTPPNNSFSSIAVGCILPAKSGHSAADDL
ncbi:MAG: hypothetical protein D6767_06515 [Candidatus Hydrogenedentota bacterium]|nr:MAG: hypothetical protein D6767_06515 [Candidatus Hydrogenedentota bacterium]